MSRRLTFTSVGDHFHLGLCEDLLVCAGYEYVPWQQVLNIGVSINFALAGFIGNIPTDLPHIPAIVLSSCQVYSCLKSDGTLADEAFLEHQPLVVPSTMGMASQAQSIYAEVLARAAFPDHAVLRLFDIYGQGASGWINFYINQLKSNRPLLVMHSPQRKISCLFIDDFRDAFLAFVTKFINSQVRGLYNLGSDQAITFTHLADTVYQAWTGTKEKAPIHLEPAPYHVNFYEVPDITRIKALLHWSPKVTLRKGVWTIVQELR